jgi:hypothetical protein
LATADRGRPRRRATRERLVAWLEAMIADSDRLSPRQRAELHGVISTKPGLHRFRGALGLRDLAVEKAAISAYRGPPNSCLLNERRPSGLAGAHRWNLLIAELRDPANEQRDKYRQRHPRHGDRPDPVSDVHTRGYPRRRHRNEMQDRSRTAEGCAASHDAAAAARPPGTFVHPRFDPDMLYWLRLYSVAGYRSPSDPSNRRTLQRVRN